MWGEVQWPAQTLLLLNRRIQSETAAGLEPCSFRSLKRNTCMGSQVDASDEGERAARRELWQPRGACLGKWKSKNITHPWQRRPPCGQSPPLGAPAPPSCSAPWSTGRRRPCPPASKCIPDTFQVPVFHRPLREGCDTAGPMLPREHPVVAALAPLAALLPCMPSVASTRARRAEARDSVRAQHGAVHAVAPAPARWTCGGRPLCPAPAHKSQGPPAKQRSSQGRMSIRVDKRQWGAGNGEKLPARCVHGTRGGSCHAVLALAQAAVRTLGMLGTLARAEQGGPAQRARPPPRAPSAPAAPAQRGAAGRAGETPSRTSPAARTAP